MKYYDKNDLEDIAVQTYTIVLLERGAGHVKARHINNELKSRYGNKNRTVKKNGRNYKRKKD